MAIQLFSNHARALSATTLALAGTSLTVGAGEGAQFSTPTTQQFEYLVLVYGTVWEIVKLTSRTGDVLIIERAQESTLARDWPIGTTVDSRITADTLFTLQRAQTYYDMGDFDDNAGTLQVNLDLAETIKLRQIGRTAILGIQVQSSIIGAISRLVIYHSVTASSLTFQTIDALPYTKVAFLNGIAPVMGAPAGGFSIFTFLTMESTPGNKQIILQSHQSSWAT